MLGLVIVVIAFELTYGARDFADADATALTREQIAAVRAAHATQNAIMNEPLHDEFEIAMGNALAIGDLAALHGLIPTIIGDVNNSIEGET